MALAKSEFVARPFAGLPGERDLIAFREIVQVGTGTFRLTKKYGGHAVTAATLLPNFWLAWKKSDGSVVVALQTRYSSGDASRDIASALLKAIDAEPGTAISSIDIDADGPRLQDICDATVPFDGTIPEDGFGFWFDESTKDNEDVKDAVKQANESVSACEAVDGVESGYWTRLTGREFFRWSIGLEEDVFLDALARLHAKRESAVIEGAKYAGAFRSCGLVIPVWELPRGTEADELPAPVAAFRTKLDKALAMKGDLSVDERRARAGLVARSVTLR